MNVFLSHSRQDKPLAAELHRLLSERGLDVWLDSAEVLPGEDLFGAIHGALEGSDAMVLLMTPAALGSAWVDAEITHALTHKEFQGRVVPVLGRGVESFQLPWILRSFRIVRLESAAEDDLRQAAEEIAATLSATA